jgi:hypothetical protein
MQEKWNQFVYYLREAKKNGVEEPEYHSTIEAQLQLLGWMRYKNEICHKPNLSIGNNGHIQPDILIQKDDKKQFVIEVKRPLHTQIAKDRDQLVSYMRQLKLKAGIYIGEHIEIFYDQPDSENAVSVLTIPLELDNKRGARFVELFSKDRFSKEAIVQFCEDRIKELRHQESLNKIKDHLVTDAQGQITEGMKMYLMEKYGNTFSESDIVGMLASLNFTATPKDGQQLVVVTPVPASQKQGSDTTKPKQEHDKTQYSINGSAFLGKRRFVHQLVKLYVEQHPTATFPELEKVFPPTLQGSYGVIRTVDYIREKGVEEYRYLMKANEVLRSADGVTFAVCSQWGIGNTPRVVELAKKLGYNITTSGKSTKADTPKVGVKTEGTIPCVLTRNANAKGIFDISTQSLTVLKGSTINPQHLDKIKPDTKKKRDALIAEFTERRDDELVVVKDAIFNSPSGAAVFCVGGSSNGWKDWRDEKNNELDIYRK